MEIKYNSLSTDHQQTYKYRPQYTTAIKLHQSTHHSVIRCLLTVFAGCSCFSFFLLQTELYFPSPQRCLFILPNFRMGPCWCLLLVLSIKRVSGCLNWRWAAVIHYLFLGRYLGLCGNYPWTVSYCRTSVYRMFNLYMTLLQQNVVLAWLNELNFRI